MQFPPRNSFLHVHKLGNVFDIFLSGYGVFSYPRLTLIILLKCLNPFILFLDLTLSPFFGSQGWESGETKTSESQILAPRGPESTGETNMETSRQTHKETSWKL